MFALASSQIPLGGGPLPCGCGAGERVEFGRLVWLTVYYSCDDSIRLLQYSRFDPRFAFSACGLQDFSPIGRRSWSCRRVPRTREVEAGQSLVRSGGPLVFVTRNRWFQAQIIPACDIVLWPWFYRAVFRVDEVDSRLVDSVYF